MSKINPEEPDFCALFESAPGLYLVLRPDLTIVAVSDAYLAATMTRRDEILGRGIFDVFPDNPADPNATGTFNLRASLERVLSGRKPDAMAVQKYDIRRPESEGGGFEERYWSPVNSPVLGPEGVRYIIHRVEDVTDFVRLKRQGLERERTTEELRTRADAMESEILQRAQEIQEANRQLRELQQDLELRVHVRTEELERANEQLRHAQKMEAVGRLAGGVAHDFNNILTAIMGYAQLLSIRFKPGDPALRETGEIVRAADQAALLTRQLLAFSRREVLQPRIVNWKEVLRDTELMLRRLLGEPVELTVASDDDLWSVKADPGHLEQIIVNLSVNARDAMPNGGKLTIEAANIDVTEHFADDRGLQPGAYAVLAVSDTGTGMDEETMARIFEPFFTTKGADKGTGLGLSTVYGIVQQWGGTIQVYSNPGWGSTFKVYLPRAKGRADKPAETIKGEIPRGTETVLLAEDQDAVAAVVRATLQLYGYNVLHASDGAEALAICNGYEGPIHLLLTDVIMPQLNGPLLAEGVRRLRPDTAILFMSGYTERAFASHDSVEMPGAFLQKPFMPETLARKVRQVLDEHREEQAKLPADPLRRPFGAATNTSAQKRKPS